jgi:hypothetical protein
MSAIAHDHQVRSLLKSHLRAGVGADGLLVDEFHLPYGAVRADLALINGHLEGFEIKADRDTLARLDRQVEAYTKVFEFSWVVTTSGHLAEVRRRIPRSWGILVARVGAPLSGIDVVRRAKRNPKQDGHHLTRLLWREELMMKLSELGLSKGLRSKAKLALFAALADGMPVDELAAYVSTCLRTRVDWRVGAVPRERGDSSHRDAIV